jgi:hypothetical protein
VPKALAVVAVGAVVSLVGWYPLGAPAGLISKLVPNAYCGASGYATGSLAMYGCAARAGALNLVGPIVVAGVLAAFRRPIARGVSSLRARLPRGLRFLLAPTLAAVFFTMAYSGIHWETAGRGGILPKQLFPALIALIAFLTPFVVRALDRAVPSLFDRRDRVAPPLRMAITLLIPLGLAFVTTNTPADVDSPVAKEQIVIVVAASLGFLAFTPRSGGLQEMGTALARRSAARLVRPPR